MRKISKISLVAALAVSGLSVANAQALEEAIKNVDVSGSVVYRYENRDDSKKDPNSSHKDDNNYKVGLNLTSKVNDMVKFNARAVVGGADAGLATTEAHRDRNGGDANPVFTLSNAYFAVNALSNTTVNVGKQGLTTPWTKALDTAGNEQTGTGILALSTIGAVTAGAGYFNNTNLDKSGDTVKGNVDGASDVYVATVQGALDFVKLEAWYLGLQDTFNSYTLAANSKFDVASAKVNLEARYVDLKLNKDLAEGDKAKNSMFRLAANAKVGIVNAKLAYVKTGKNGGLTAADNDAQNTTQGWGINANGKANADYIQVAVGANILDNLNFTLNYGNLKSKKVDTVALLNKNDIKEQEVYGQLTYKMSKNLSTYLRYGNVERKVNSTGKTTADENRGRIHVTYTF